MTYLKKSHPEPNLIIGYTSRLHLMLDLDNTTITKVRWVVNMLMKKYPTIVTGKLFFK